MSIMAVERALILLRYIVDNEEGLSIREASRNLGYSPATVQKIVSALKAQGYVAQDELTDRYHLGPEAVRLGLTALTRLDVRRAARPHLESLSEESGETVFLAISRGHFAVYVDKVVSNHAIRMDAPLGEDRPLNCTAVGKVLLSGLEDNEVESLTDYFAARTENSIVGYEPLSAELAQVRRQGWARDQEEYAYGADCVAAPVYDHEGRLVAAITVSGPEGRVAAKLDRLIEMTRSHADDISKELGFSAQMALAGGIE